jgi:hypothetical protein
MPKLAERGMIGESAKFKSVLEQQRIHPEDRSAVRQLRDRVTRERTGFDVEHRLLIADQIKSSGYWKGFAPKIGR